MSKHRTNKLRLTDDQRKILVKVCQSDWAPSLPEVLSSCDFQSIDSFERALRTLFRLEFVVPYKWHTGKRANGLTGGWIRLLEEEIQSIFPLNRFLALDESDSWHWIVDGCPQYLNYGIEDVIFGLKASKKGISFYWGNRASFHTEW